MFDRGMRAISRKWQYWFGIKSCIIFMVKIVFQSKQNRPAQYPVPVSPRGDGSPFRWLHQMSLLKYFEMGSGI